jgi:hypothetical protein
MVDTSTPAGIAAASGTTTSDFGQGDFAKARELIDITKLRGDTRFNPPMYDAMRLPRFYGEKEWTEIHKGGFGRGWIVRDPVAQEGAGNIPAPEEREIPDGESATKLRDAGWTDWKTPYGFRFLMNPGQVQETYQTSPGLDTAGTLMDVASSGFPPVIAVTGSSMSFSLLLDRQIDMRILSTKGVDALYQYYDNIAGGAYPKQEIEALGHRGTGWDLEYLFRTMNGDPWTDTDQLWHGRETSDFGVLFPFPIIVAIGDGPRTRRIRGTVTNITFNHTMFSPGMVPIRTELDISIARLTDSWHTGGLNYEKKTDVDPTDDAGGGTADGSPSGPGKSLPPVKLEDVPIQRGKWHSLHKQTIAGGQKWTVETQLMLELNSATTPIRGYEISTRYARVGWGEGQTADGKDYTGENDEQIAEHAESMVAYTHSHSLAGGGPLEYQVKVTGTGKVKLNHIIFKAVGAGVTGPEAGVTHDGSGVDATLPSTYKMAAAKVGQRSASQALSLANGKLGAQGYQNTVGYGGWCIQFVIKYCYGITSGVGVNNAYEIWDNLPSKYRHAGDTNPPAGAVPVWSSAAGGGAGHAAVSIGNGWMITTGTASNGYKIEKKRIQGYTSGYLGWIPPMFYGTRFPPAGSR